MQENSAGIMKKIAPEQTEEIFRRANIILNVHDSEPVGRRNLAKLLNMPERKVRSSSDAMIKLGLLSAGPAGMKTTKVARALLPGLRKIYNVTEQTLTSESRLSQMLNVERVIIASGDSDNGPDALGHMCSVAAKILQTYLKPDMVIAIAGGTTMAKLAKSMEPAWPSIVVVPARGGIGSQLSTQADSIAGEMAKSLRSQGRLMHLPDELDMTALKELEKLPSIKEVLELISMADILLLGIGRADKMARRRGLLQPQIETLLSLGAVGESAGHFFNMEGHTVYQSPSVGAHVGLPRNGGKIISVAGGLSKAEAIIGAVRHHKPDVLVTDTGAAQAMEEILSKA
ncbi:MAG: sugar-binding domain-containing protein [Eubacteriales bacterium]|nr:sugar-binding domain-containing protein [Eubacteriales bacterium]